MCIQSSCTAAFNHALDTKIVLHIELLIVNSIEKLSCLYNIQLYSNYALRDSLFSLPATISLRYSGFFNASYRGAMTGC